MSDTQKMKPLFLIKPKAMSARDIRRAEKFAGVIIIECAEPEESRFLQPPIDAQIDIQARAALDLMRHIVAYGDGSATTTFSRGYLMKWFLDALMYAQKPASVPQVKPVKK